MTTLADLHNTRAREVAALEALLSAAEAEGRRLTDDEQQEFDDHRAAIGALDAQLTKGFNMDIDQPQGALRALVPHNTSLSSGLPSDIAAQVERNGRVSYEVKSSLVTLAKNIIGENMATGVPPNINVAGPLAWRLVDGALPYSPSLLELLPVVGVSGAGILQHILDYEPPAQAGNHAALVPEAQAKPESDLSVTTSTLAFQTWAHWIQVTRQCLSDIPSLRVLLDSILIRGLLRKVDAGIYATLSAAATAFAPPSGSTTNDTAVLAMSQVAALGGRGVTLVLNPADRAAALLAKCAGSGCYMGFPPEAASIGRIVASPAIPQGTFLCFSSEACYIAERESVNVIAGVHNDGLIKNIVTLLAEWRGIAVLSQPAYLLTGELASAGGAEGASAPLGRHAGGPRRG